MKRKLAILNLLLCSFIAAAGWQLRQMSLTAGNRDQKVLKQQLRASTSQPLPPTPGAQPLAAAVYGDIAQRMLFAKDRNPTVVVDEAPPKPMPPLPTVYGVIQFTDGPTVIMKEKQGSPERGVHLGEQVGEFRLISANGEELVLEWNGQKIARKLDELTERGGKTAPPVASVQQADSPVSNAPAASPRTTAVTTTVGKQEGGFGVELQGGFRACQAGDTSPGGTIREGMKKVAIDSPFGQYCRWEPVK